MSALGQKQTSRHLQPMLPPKADIAVPSLLMHFGYPGRRAADSETDEPPGCVVSTSGGPPRGRWLHHAAIGSMRALRGSSRRFDPDFGFPLACLYRDNRWHQLLLWIPNRLQEKPLEVGRCTRLLLWSRQISHDGVPAIPRTVAPLAKPPAPMMDESNTAIAMWI